MDGGHALPAVVGGGVDVDGSASMSAVGGHAEQKTLQALMTRTTNQLRDSAEPASGSGEDVDGRASNSVQLELEADESPRRASEKVETHPRNVETQSIFMRLG